MKKYIFLLFIVVVGFTGGDVQRELIKLNWIDVTETNNNKNGFDELNFDGAEFPDVETQIPVFHKVYNLSNGEQDFTFSIENLVFEEIFLSEDFPGYYKVANEVNFETQKYQSNGQFKLHLLISTLKKENDKFFRLKEFQLKQIPVEKTVRKKGELSIRESHVWKSSSVLQQGRWYKIGVSGKGVVKIPYTKLSSMGFSDPSKVNVFGSGGTILSENPGEITYDDLEQCAVWHDKNNGTDCLFFYSPGTIEWQPDFSNDTYKHKLNDYTTKGYFFLTDNSGNRKVAQMSPSITEPATHNVSSADAYLLHEQELENVLHLGSGKQWFGEKFKHSSVKNIDFQLKDVDPAGEVKLRVNAIARSYANSEILIDFNQTNVGTLNFNQVNTGSQTSSYANEQEGIFTTSVQNENSQITLKYYANKGIGTDDNAIAWLDYIELTYLRKLRFGNEALFFRSQKTLGAGNVISFNIENAGTGSRVFDVTDMNNVQEVELNINGGMASMIRSGNELREYLAFNPNGNYSEPEYVGEIENQNVHALSTHEFIIITHTNFLNLSNR